MLTRKPTSRLGALALAFICLTTPLMAVTVLVEHSDALAWEGHATYPGFAFAPVTPESDENILHAEFDVNIAGLTDGGIFSRWLDAAWNEGNNEWMNMFNWYAWDPVMVLGATIWSPTHRLKGNTDATQKTHTWHCSATLDMGSTPKTHSITVSDTEGDGEYSFTWTSNDIEDGSKATSIGYIQWELQSAIGSEPPPTVNNVLVVKYASDETGTWRAEPEVVALVGPQDPAGAAAPRGPTLVDVTSLMGITGTGSSAAWGDYDNDGWVDLFDGRLWHNTLGSSGEGFEQVEMPATGAGIWADYDNDGFLDLYVIQQHKLVRFDGEKFVDASSLLPPKQIMRSYAATWGDFNGDGFVDLYITGFETVSHAAPIYDIILNNEAGKGFKHVWNARWKYAGRGVTIADYDEDGDTDIYVSNYRLLPNYMWRNNGSGGFHDIGAHNGTCGDGAGKAWGHTIGSCWGDFDNDGHIDLFVGNFSHAPAYQDRCKFYRNLGPEGDYGFADLSGEVDFRWQESYASPALGDVDGDGFLDVVITTYYSGDKAMMVANRSADLATVRPTNLSHDQSPIGKWTFAEVTEDVGIVASRTSQAAWADFDNDGDLDLMLGGKLLRNEMPARRWLKVKLDAPSTAEGKLVNRAAIGATVRVHVNGWVLTRTVEGATGQANQNDLTLHFGLGDYNGTVDIEVAWPDGSKQKTTAEVDRLVRIAKGEMRRL
jgi:hypothetical protein